jgi:RNA polymerase sigma-70 factor, ECF subfamily
VQVDTSVSACSKRQKDALSPSRPRPPVVAPRQDRKRTGEIFRTPPPGQSDHLLIAGARAGDEDAATQLYLRYAKRLTSLVKKQCSTDLARCAGVEDIVQSVFGTFFRRVNQGCYDIPEGDTIWKMLLVLAMNRVRTQATYCYAAKRDAHRTIGGAEGQHRLELHSNVHQTAAAHLELALKEIVERLPPQNRLLVRLRIEGFTVADVAMIAGRSKRTVERVIQHTRQMLSELLLKTD